MEELFHIETDRLSLSWKLGSSSPPAFLAAKTTIPGRLVVKSRRSNLVPTTWRSDVPASVAREPGLEVGPRLFEQTGYQVYLQSKTKRGVQLTHRDPLIVSSLSTEDSGRIVFGDVNFRNQVGRSEFTVLADGSPELNFEVEVFPSKLDYQSDYQQLLAEAQDVLTGLAMEYLRSTYQLGQEVVGPQPTQLEWLALLKSVASDLERAVRHIAQRPIRGLTRDPRDLRVERVRRVDSALRSAVRRGAGSGPLIGLRGGIEVRHVLPERRARPTLDTPEHRWLASQLGRIRRRLGRLRAEEIKQEATERRKKAVEEIDGLEATMGRLLRLEPLAASSGEPPAGFASMQLLGAPGYREAYRSCLILALGLRIEGGPLQLSVKDIDVLYEYWCYLAVLRLASQITGSGIPPRKLLSLEQRGLQVLLRRGTRTAVRFKGQAGRKLTVTYNRTFGKGLLIPQKPDIVLTVEEPNWPKLYLILDAKYRVDASEKYQKVYGTPGPPQDALNTMHRYRDAILEEDSAAVGPSLKHAVVQAAALFPYHEKEPGTFRDGRLWAALDRIGIGALPLLPGETSYLEEWLVAALQQGGWALADRAIPHRSAEQSRSWRQAASEAALVGVLRSQDPQAHLDWIAKERLYYAPLTKQRRQYGTRWVAVYSPKALRRPGAVTHRAKVAAVDVVPRRNISTPWKPRGGRTKLQIVYRLSGLEELSQPIPNTGLGGRGTRFSQNRWTSRLALDRAHELRELFLETEPEWRLYENLRSLGATFHLRPGRVQPLDPEDPRGRAWFVLPEFRLQYRGSGGFLWKDSEREERLGNIADLTAAIADELQANRSL